MVENQNLDKIRETFGLNQDVNSVNAQGQTALHISATKDLADIAAVLLARGATVDAVDLQGNTALHLAVKLGVADLLKDGPCTASDLAKATETHAPSLTCVLRLLASVGIFAEPDGGR